MADSHGIGLLPHDIGLSDLPGQPLCITVIMHSTLSDRRAVLRLSAPANKPNGACLTVLFPRYPAKKLLAAAGVGGCCRESTISRLNRPRQLQLGERAVYHVGTGRIEVGLYRSE